MKINPLFCAPLRGHHQVYIVSPAKDTKMPAREGVSEPGGHYVTVAQDDHDPAFIEVASDSTRENLNLTSGLCDVSEKVSYARERSRLVCPRGLRPGNESHLSRRHVKDNAELVGSWGLLLPVPSTVNTPVE